MKRILTILLFAGLVLHVTAQETICINEAITHRIQSKYLGEPRNHWVSLPFRYSDTLSYPVIYVFDAEWRFELIRNIVFDWGANKKIQNAIIVGIPHIDWKSQRGIDLTFSQTRNEYDGEAVDSTWYNATNSGGGSQFYQYLTQELIPHVNHNYATNGHETLIGHSYGGYFAGYLLSLDHPFEVLHIYDPSIWYSNGEVISRFRDTDYTKETRIHITYQPEPAFHREKIEAFIAELEKTPSIILTMQFYPEETHNSLFIDSFYRGILETNR